jgi:hypothetical protein
MQSNGPVMSSKQPRLVLLCGLPGSGKTTLGRRLETELSAMRFCPDDWLTDLGVDLDETMRERLEQLFWDIGQRLLGLGQSVILESGFWLRSDRDENPESGQPLDTRNPLRTPIESDRARASHPTRLLQ